MVERKVNQPFESVTAIVFLVVEVFALRELLSIPPSGQGIVRENNFSFNDRPHPGPLLRGEGETLAAFFQIRAADFTTRCSPDGTRDLVKSSPGGEDLGEGGQ